jgi:hypothetical protein
VKKKVLFEDTVSYYNKWVSGLASREFNAQRLKFKDLFSTNHDLTDQSPNDAKAGNVLPFPLPNIVSTLGDLTTNMSNSISAFSEALKHPNVKDDLKARKEIEIILTALKKAQHEINQVFTEVGVAAVEDDDKSS